MRGAACKCAASFREADEKLVGRLRSGSRDLEARWPPTANDLREVCRRAERRAAGLQLIIRVAGIEQRACAGLRVGIVHCRRTA